MNFDKINVYGFKSFADKVEIKFEPGITAIVGPNGCGKSNVADAIRYVMGESSAKSMRGSSMQDVIFNGTEKRKAQSYCEVSLHFNNSQRMFETMDVDEVILTRKLYKSGESEYLINKNICRKRDIVDAFRTIGLGKSSYCVIGQGKIDSILSAKPEDRRHVFEEAAGISKFKEDRNSANNKLANVTEKLIRINDITNELERQLGPMKTQAENAKIFVELSNRLKELEINIYVHNYDNSNVEKQKIYDIIKALDEEIALKQADLETAIKEYEMSQGEIDKLDESINELRNELLNLSVALEKQNGEIKLFNEKISNLQEQNNKYKLQIEQGNTYKENVELQSQKLQNDKENTENLIKNSEKELEKLQMEYKLTVEKLNLGENLAESVDAELFSAVELQGDIKSTMLKYQTELDALKQRQTELTTEKENLEKESRNYENKITFAEGEIENLESKIEEKNEERKNIIEEINDLNNQIADFGDEIEQKKADYHTGLSKFNVLSEMKEYNEGFIIGVKRLLEQAQDGSSIGGKVIGVVASLMKVPQKYEVAIEMALGASVQNIVTKNEHDAKSLIDYLKVNRFGRVTFLPMTSVKSRSIPPIVKSNLKMKGVCGVADELISFDKEYSGVFSSLLGATIIVDNMDNAIAFSKATGFSVRIVTLDGDIISPQGSMTGGSRKQDTVNIIGREREIEDLEKKLDVLKNEIDEMVNDLNNMRKKSADKTNELSSKIDEIHALEMEKAKQDELVGSYEENIDDISSKLSDLEISFMALLDKIDFVERQIEISSMQQKDVDMKKSQASENKKQANDDYGRLRTTRDEILQKISELKIQIESQKNDLNNIVSESERLVLSVEENDFKSRDVMLEIQKNNQEIESYNKSIEEIMSTDKFSASAKQVEGVKQKIESLTEEKKLAQVKMNQADGNKMLLSGEIQRANDKKAKEENLIVRIDTELENLQNRVWEEYQMTYGYAK
ncbi:MAG: chromosome segregation protein SMC [Clostridia bacterium]|nr:chromosome segregation protein SMC [Clostridia bacterium]